MRICTCVVMYRIHVQVWDELAEKAASLSVGQLVRLRQIDIKSTHDRFFLDMRPNSNAWIETRGLDPKSDTVVRDTQQRLRDMVATATAAAAANDALSNPVVAPTASGGGPMAPTATFNGARAAVTAHPAAPPTRAFCTRVTGTSTPAVTPVAVALVESAPKKFRLQCQCTDVLPDDYRDVCRVLCEACGEFFLLPDVRKGDGDSGSGGAIRSCPKCDRPTTFYYVFCVRLQDASGSIVARVCGTSAETLLGGGVPATDLYANNCSLEVVRRKLAKMSAPDAMVDCVVVKYTPAHKPSTELFQVVETQIL